MKFLNCLQPKRYKYVTGVCLAKNVRDALYDDLFDYLQQYEKLVIASRLKKGDTFQNDLEDPLTFAMMLLAHAITQRYSTPTNNRLRSSSNIRNQAIVQSDRVNIQNKNAGNDGRIVRRSYNTQEESTKGSNVHKEIRNVQRNLRILY
nr:hypothetical protein [Tanacetum cinerariifolium]